MLNETFFINGIDARSVGIYLERPISFEEPTPDVETEPVAGRNGDLLFYSGTYLNRSASANCFALKENVLSIIGSINKFLIANKGYQKLSTSDDSEHYWMARVVNGASISQRMRTLNPFSIEFDCKPQRFLLTGEESIEFTEDGTIINRYGFPAAPIIRVNGSGSGVLNIGSFRVNILNLDEKGIVLDSDTMNAYNNDGNKNMSINTDEFPLLVDGENSVSFTGGIDSVEIVPRWWEL
jgi:phage-related protein